MKGNGHKGGEKLSQLFDRYFDFKKLELKPSSLKNLRSVQGKIKEFPSDEISEKAARSIREHLLKSGTEDSARRTIQQLNAACNWGLDRGEIQSNPFSSLQMKSKKKKPPIDPFSEHERDLIIKEFERNPNHSHYSSYVKFLFLTGCRPSEAIGLTWGDIQEGHIKLWSPVVEGSRMDSLKNGDLRFFPINNQLRALLDEVGPHEPSRSIFVSQSGCLINGGNFLRRHWKPVLKILKIRYRKAYNTRHTFVTICLIKGEKPETIARWIGDNPITMMKYYAGFIPGHVPEL